MSRREFTQKIKVEIIKRATRGLGLASDQFCEKCGEPTKGRFDIHHIREDALEIDKSKPLTAADGAVLCRPCHKKWTAEYSVPMIAKVKRIEARHLGAKTSKAKIPGPPRAPRSTEKLDSIRALGPPMAFRSIGDIAGEVLEKITPRKDAAE